MTLTNNTFKCVEMELVAGNVMVKLAIDKDEILGSYTQSRDVNLILNSVEAKQFEIGREYTINFIPIVPII